MAREKIISIRVDDDMLSEIQRLADMLGVSRGEATRRCLRRGVEEVVGKADTLDYSAIARAAAWMASFTADADTRAEFDSVLANMNARRRRRGESPVPVPALGVS